MSDQSRPPPPRPVPSRGDSLTFLYEGNHYRLGVMPESRVYRIWTHDGTPLDEFPVTEQGWQEAWSRFLRLAPQPTPYDREGHSQAGPERDAVEIERQRAEVAWSAGDSYFQVDLVLSQSDRPGWTLETRDVRGDDIPRTIAAIASVGWRLEHTNYVFVPLEESSR